MIRVETTPRGWHLHVCGRRWHHGFSGCLLVVVGLVLVLHDLADIAQWWPRVEGRRPDQSTATVRGAGTRPGAASTAGA